MELFGENKPEKADGLSPLAHRMKPRTLDEFVGQDHIIGEGTLLRRAIAVDRVSSLILYGPPGCGKTALAMCIADATSSHFARINAVTSGIKDIRRVIDEARERRRLMKRRTIVFIDEIHRFNRAQQDALMPDVEAGNIVLIGATVHNPYFSVISPLISRSMVFTLHSLRDKDIETILHRALKDKERGLGRFNVQIARDAVSHLASYCEGDARRALNALEIGVLVNKPSPDGTIHFDLKTAEESIQKKAITYDREGDEHYNTISAFIKSMRGSDPDSALYWMAKMLYGGETPEFIARRVLICASEDVGNADPMALVLASAALRGVEFVGMPEAKIIVDQAVTYIATAPKSNAAYLGISSAMKDVEEKKLVPVPMHLRDANFPGAEALGHGKGYRYPHDYKGHFIEQYYGAPREYYRPAESGFEAEILSRMQRWKDKKKRDERKKTVEKRTSSKKKKTDKK